MKRILTLIAVLIGLSGLAHAADPKPVDYKKCVASFEAFADEYKAAVRKHDRKAMDAFYEKWDEKEVEFIGTVEGPQLQISEAKLFYFYPKSRIEKDIDKWAFSLMSKNNLVDGSLVHAKGKVFIGSEQIIIVPESLDLERRKQNLLVYPNLTL